MPLITINAPTEITFPPTMGGVSQETWDDLSFWTSRGGSCEDIGNERSEVKLTDRYMPLATLNRWCSLGSEVTDYPCFFEITNPEDVCPFSDPENPETWNEWGVVGDSHKPVEIEGKWYRSNLEGVQGTPLIATRWYSYINTPADGIVRVMTTSEFQDLQPTDPIPA